ncbi:MAG: hypothetical protein A2358_00355 [Candidatus Staskawiczbacteria bacterium RIFOXYB1_FULL_37_44]|uniref:Uncharacterized protein n=1 Tax=Candidatus Staskawiczbacteria bacterium RIFOXYB1_FULL_37_44 TaxID=1802223 RepID=A0A1G2IXH0_9BACT|nr:MAG: hypothetical protein A2358_00355 [Candidatus Staskawiczbacteria bacterium RIFOXYB1_FULL_37_44]OGZ83466.1 MAG: hypothetical protein A2416_04020 [Candidatus Staskawiczbacteria bacterium RIFOXYC1_FULL_37_52]OGZ88484.1 MAG: hypothetical protein A2444_02630 [Candidatus Staskawiczbacteria bacterium RIFOXYC2_FULL_37_19]OGZ90196.1 MAG: hypothetical protein A2581_02185 [Candidatus Staskawiczbacteria bacterium RIFOXYD1_FULL_37_110]
MRVNKCDLCQKEISFEQRVVAGTGFSFSPDAELCLECGEPVLRFLRRHKIIDKNNKKIKEI